MQELYILPFDHRGSFMTLVKAASPPTTQDIEKARSYKQMIYEAFKLSVAAGVPKAKAGILVDEWLGRDILLDARSQGFITSMPLEKSGQDEFDFDRPDWKKQIEDYAPTYTKVLVRYNPEGDKELNIRQATKLAVLGSYLAAQKKQFLFELLVPATPDQLTKAGSQETYDQKMRPGLMVKAIKELQERGVNPDVWKLEGLDSTESMEQVATQVGAGNRTAKIIILGRGESAQKAEQWLRMGAKIKEAIGFAVGRTVFKDALEAYAAGTLTREQAIKKIADNYTFFVNVWKKVKGY